MPSGEKNEECDQAESATRRQTDWVVHRDTLSDFLEWLESHFDEHDTEMSEIASALLVSRPVLDRLVVAATGEPPGSLRRRVQLERAAFELRATSRTILDVAIEAGYASHEAFTRAFLRHYGVGPAAWRSSAKPMSRADDGMVHFYPPSGIRFPQKGSTMKIDLPTGYFEHHVDTITRMIECARTLPSEALDLPITVSVATVDDSPSIRSLLSRLVGQLEMWSAAMSSEPYDFSVESYESLETMQSRLARVGPTFVQYVRDTSEQGTFGETFVDTTCESPRVFTSAGMLAHIMTYGSYRRTLVACALESATSATLSDDPMNWFLP